jgi:murein DD-endopeptidase MepM/ murein hydrolase activator NlpD
MINNMQNNFNEESSTSTKSDKNKGQADASSAPSRRPSLIARWMNSLVQMGLGESLLRVGTNLFSIVAITIVILLAQAYYRQTPSPLSVNSNQDSSPAPAAVVDINSIPALDIPIISGISRAAQLHTNVPSRPRNEITEYEVQKGDTINGIADKFGLQPKTIFAANYAILQDNPDNLFPGEALQILPVDGVIWEWTGGISFGSWADYFQVKPEDIINFPANNLDPNIVGDPQNANIPTGKWLVIPGGKYEYHLAGSLPLGITRTNPASAQVGGAGSCPPITGGAVGTGLFIYPTDKHTLSGYGYSEKNNHRGIDLAGDLGANLYATDGGVIVYAGWNDYGYGNMIMIDHGTGFQSLYGHMSQIFVSCGENVSQGQVIGAVGSSGHSSGPHLHFEIRTLSTVVNPWDLLPPP